MVMSGAAVIVSVMANAIKASGVVVQVLPEDFLIIVQQSENALVVHAQSKIIRTTHKYLTSYKGLAFYTKLDKPFDFLSKVELIEAKRISIPDM